MSIMQHFLTYAGNFEKTLADDDWTRLRQYFANDAIYDVKSEGFGCHLIGRDAIFRGMKKSLDGFDRRFSKRDIAVLDGPHLTENGLEMGWQVTYGMDRKPPFVLRGRSIVRYAGEQIVYLSDLYDASAGAEFAKWQRETGLTLDPSYT